MVRQIRNLQSMFGPVRDQGRRNTCLAMATSDLHAGVRGTWLTLSCEYLFYHAQRRAGQPPSAAGTIPSTLAALQHDGQPAKSAWPYQNSTPSDPSQWRPPAIVGPVYRRSGTNWSGTVDEIIDSIDRSEPVLAALWLSGSFLNPSPDGIVDPPQGELPDRSIRHAVIALGHGQHRGRRVVLIRNSWGVSWGQGGYAWLTERFLEPRLLQTVVLDLNLNFTPRITT